MIELVVHRVNTQIHGGVVLVVLKEKKGPRYLPIFMDPHLAESIFFGAQNARPDRPLTHDLALSVIRTLGAEVHSAVITDLANDTFYALLRLWKNGGIVTLDSRPSDAIAIAVRAGAPILAEEKVLDLAGQILKIEEAPQQETVPPSEGITPVTKEEAERLRAFKDVVEKIDFGDPLPPEENS